MATLGPDRVKTQTPGRLFMNFSRFSAFSAITGPAERKNSLQMRRFQTISEFSHGLGRIEPFGGHGPNGRFGTRSTPREYCNSATPDTAMGSSHVIPSATLQR